MALKAHLEQPAAGVESRSQPRMALRLVTQGLASDGVEANVTIHNLSAAGLLVETDLALDVGDRLAVGLPEVGPVGAEIVWASEWLYGCAFEQALGEAALAAAQLRGEVPEIASQPGPSAATSQPTGLMPARSGKLSDTLGYRLNKLRRERGMTLAQVASALSVSKPTVWAWEKGKARPLPERIAAIAEVLGVTEADLNEASEDNAGASLVEECRLRIAAQYGTSPESVRIMIEV